MPFAISGKIEGVEALVKSLEDLDAKLRKRVLKKAVGEASKMVLRAAKAGVRKDTGLLKKSLGRKVKVYRHSGVVVAIVGPRKGFKTAVTRKGQAKATFANPTQYAHLVELGTSRSQAFPFMGPAFEQTKAAAREAMEEIVAEGLKSAKGR